MIPKQQQKVAKRQRNKQASAQLKRTRESRFFAIAKERFVAVTRNSRTIAWTLLYLALGAAIPFAGYQVYSYMRTSPYFAIRTLELKGGHQLTSEQIQRYLRLDATPKPNILSVDPNRLVAALHEHPWIRTAKVKKRLPDRLIVSIEERRPAAYISLGRLYLVDQYGEVFKEVEPADDYNLPIITGFSRKDFKDETARLLARKEVKEALHLHRIFLQKKLGTWIALSEINIHRLLGFSFVTDDGVVIRLGRRELEKKLARLRAMYPVLRKKKRKLRAVFLNNRRHPERVLVRYSGMKSELQRPKGDPRETLEPQNVDVLTPELKRPTKRSTLRKRHRKRRRRRRKRTLSRLTAKKRTNDPGKTPTPEEPTLGSQKKPAKRGKQTPPVVKKKNKTKNLLETYKGILP
ncbi:MAG: FtsQ-type POTRA domain-containing protein [Myxococcales bacterium]|nr:FtsQ-type POTRA domain-containing protein [Myxococcales bacterium]